MMNCIEKTVTQTGVNSAEQPAEDNLIRLLERLVSSPSIKPTFYPAELPENLPVEIPIPDDAELIGSVAWDNERFEVILDVPRKPKDVLEFYRKSLNETGWVEMPESPSYGGFSPFPWNYTSFCRNESKGPRLSIVIYKREGLSEVRLMLDNSSLSCRLGSFPESVSILPVLYPPEGAQCFGEHSGSSSGRGYHIVYSLVFLKTDLNSKELEAYYRSQLQKNGWKVERIFSGENFSYSVYNVTKRDIQWKGVLTVQVINGSTKMAHLVAIAQY
jgi:hypothetical protein